MPIVRRQGSSLPKSGVPATVEFVYGIGSGRATLIYWLDFAGNPVDMSTFDGATVALDSYVGHAFIVKDFDGKCYGGVFVAEQGYNTFYVA